MQDGIWHAESDETTKNNKTVFITEARKTEQQVIKHMGHINSFP
jgi:hypothetical protein